MSFAEASKLRVNDKVDYRDDFGRFIYGTVKEKKGTALGIVRDECKTLGVWCDYKKEIYRLAKAGTISRRPAHRLTHFKERDYVYVNPAKKYPDWKYGEITMFDKKSGQVQVIVSVRCKVQKQNYYANYSYWVHLDNTSEITEVFDPSQNLFDDSSCENSMVQDTMGMDKPQHKKFDESLELTQFMNEMYQRQRFAQNQQVAIDLLCRKLVTAQKEKESLKKQLKLEKKKKNESNRFWC